MNILSYVVIIYFNISAFYYFIQLGATFPNPIHRIETLKKFKRYLIYSAILDGIILASLIN